MPYERHERGCGCERCVKRREYARERYYAKKNGEEYKKERTRGPNKKGTLSDLRLPQPSDPTGRFLVDEGSDGSIVHWMPKEAEEWECPHCPASFYQTDGRWFRQS